MSDGMSGWVVISVNINGFIYFIQKNEEGWFVYRVYLVNQNFLNFFEDTVVYYWQVLFKYFGNWVRYYLYLQVLNIVKFLDKLLIKCNVLG